MASLLPIALGVRKAEREISKGLIEKALRRDGGTCCFCGFKAGMFQTAVPREPFSGDEKSVVTCCTFCERSLFLDKAGLSSLGVLIWLPEMSQAALNHVARALYVARAGKDEKAAATASRAIDSFLARKSEAKKRLGTDDPLLLATALSETLSDADYARRGPKLEGIRLFPLDKQIVVQAGAETDIFPRILAYWTSPEGPFGRKWAA